MLRHVAAFELRYQLRQPLLWATAAAFAMLSFVATATDALQISGPVGNLQRNAPFIVVRMLGDLSLLGAFIAVAVVAGSALRDFERRTGDLIFSTPVSTGQLLLGRFVGALLAACACIAFALPGAIGGTFVPWLDPDKVASFDARPYLVGVTMLAFANLAILGAVFFAIASRVRHVMGTYAALVAFLVAYFVGTAMFSDLESRRVAAWLDPFGLTAFDLQTRYWTVAERNSRLPGLAGELLWNRLLWLTIALVVLGWAVSTFRYAPAARRRSLREALAQSREAAASEPAPRRRGTDPPPFTRVGTPCAQLGAQFRLECRLVLRAVPFLLILSLGLINVLANMGYLELMLGTPVWPVTHLMLLAISSGYSFLLILILTFYAGESVWRERGLMLDGIVDASPVSAWVPLTAKLLALWTASAVFLAAGMMGLIGFQLYHGHTRVEPGLYAQGLVVEVVPFLLIAVLAVFFQVAVNQKFLGYLLMVLYLVSNGVLRALHFDHHLYRYASAPNAPYSDMNGWGHFAPAVFWFDTYWSLAAGILFCLAFAGWVRGSDTTWRARWRTARARMRGRVRWAIAVLAVCTAGVGGFIFYNTNVLNEYVSSDEAERRQAEYEHRYGRYRDVAQPKIVSIRTEVDIQPGERRADIRGTYRLVNRSDSPISALHVLVPPRVTIRRLAFRTHRTVVDDRRLGYAVHELESPLAPGEEMPFAFHLEIANHGFVNGGADNSVVGNGTFFHSRQFPAFGYQDAGELRDPSARRRHGLPPPVRMPKIDDPDGRAFNDLASDADLLEFEATVSTSPDQIAIAPGDLEREWTAAGRRFFHYRMRTPIPKFFAFLSGRYEVRRDSWQGIGIEVFHHGGHPYNVDRMVDAVKKTLRYMTEHVSPYQHRHVRIVEFPRYTRMAASFPNTIPFSESIGFIARLEDADDIDYPFYVTAHEVAHQWWGYQVLPAAVQGAGMLSESLAQYSALMVMEREYGAAQMRRFLEHELDNYLSGRSGELIEEMPLALVENQPYIHYRKGSLVFYALKDAIGEATLNGALRRYVASVNGRSAPYTVSRELLAVIRGAVAPRHHSLVEDLFEAITLYDLETTETVARPLPDGRYEVTLEATARKLRADGQGVETEVPVDDWIDIGVFGADPAGDARPGPALYLKKHYVSGPEITVRAIVKGVPVRAGIDPFAKLIDRRPRDNVRPVLTAHRVSP